MTNDHLIIDGASFLQPETLAAEVPRLTGALTGLRDEWAQRRDRRDSAYFFALPYLEGELARAQVWAQRIRAQAQSLVVFGIGGSSLGAEMLVAGVGSDGLPVQVYDNIDPTYLAALALRDWRETFLLVVSKSGETAETLAQLLTTLPVLEQQLGARLKEQLAVVTENPDSSLGRIADALGAPVIPHLAVGGRYSVLSVTGLLPAAVAGVAVDRLLAGAVAMAERCLAPDNPVLQQAAAQYLMAGQGRTQSVLLTYGERLARTAAWYAQLWAESLGKRNAAGRGVGLTPLLARGVSDQHSQLQLYLDGPNDKQFTFLVDETLAGQGREISDRFADLPAVAPLAGHTTGALFEAELRGTRDALAARQAPVRTLALPRDPFAQGQLILLWQAETVAVARLLAIDPFDQPAVEDSKRRARAYLAAAGPGGGAI